MVKRNEREILSRLRKCKIAEGLPKSSMEVKDSIRYKTKNKNKNKKTRTTTKKNQTNKQNKNRVLRPWEAGRSTESLYRDQEDHPASFHFTGEGCSFLVSYFSYWKAEVGRKLSRKRKKKPGKFPFRKTHIQGQVSRLREARKSRLWSPRYPALTRHALLKPMTTRRQLPDNRSLCPA